MYVCGYFQTQNLPDRFNHADCIKVSIRVCINRVADKLAEEASCSNFTVRDGLSCPCLYIDSLSSWLLKIVIILKPYINTTQVINVNADKLLPWATNCRG